MPSNKRPLQKHQIEATKVVRRLGGCAGVFMAPGTGKTLTAARYAMNKLPVLVVCRRDDFLTWVTELTAEGVSEESILQVDSPNIITKLEQCMMVAGVEGGECDAAGWTIVTYDLLKNDDVFDFIKRQSYGIVIADESHMIKRWDSDRTRRVIRATRHIPHRLALTGTPITNEPLDAFSQALFIDNGKTFGDNEWKFMKKYYLRSGPGWYLKRGSADKIGKLLSTISFYVHEDDVLKLPPKRHVTKSVPMSPEQKKLYDKVLNEWEVQLDSGEVIEIDHVTVQLSKLRQISGGFLYTPSGDVQAIKSCPKLDLLHDLVNDDRYMGRKKKIVIWAAHTAEINRIASTLGRAVTFYGSDRKQKEAARKQFRDDTATRFFVGQVDAGVGMNELVVAADAVYYSNSFKAVSRQQSERRIRRIGSEHHDSITYWDLISEGSVDRHVLRSVQLCIDVASSITQELKSGKKIRAVLK